MEKHYVTFGQQHRHIIGDKCCDKDTIAVFTSSNAQEGRDKAFTLFGDQFFTDYHSDAWNENKMLIHFPKGYIFL